MCNIIYWQEHFKAVDVALKGPLQRKRRLGTVCISGLIEVVCLHTQTNLTLLVRMG